MILQGEKIQLRPITEEDTELIIKWRNSDNVRNRFIFRETLTYEMHMKWLKNTVQEGLAVQFIIQDKNTKKPIGSTFLRDIDKRHNKAEFGIFIGEESSCGKGYGSEAAKLIIDYGFDQLKLHKIFLRVLTDNERAINSYKKVGFVEEGRLIDDVYLDGKYQDVILMGMIKP